MTVLISFVRNLLGGIIAFFDVITRGTKTKRSPLQQQQVAQNVSGMTLYQFFACPFCIKTRRAIYKMNLPIAKRSISKGSSHRDELLREAGKIQAPCLRIEKSGQVEWLYDSSAIIEYLRQQAKFN